jgi:acyl-CoA-binding protein
LFLFVSPDNPAEMSDNEALKEEFRKAVKAMDDYAGPALSNDQKLRFYALFKQSEKGKCTGTRPGFFDMVGKAKFDAWEALGDMTSDAAMQEYVQSVKEVVGVL